jgi:hypothetical protein
MSTSPTIDLKKLSAVEAFLQQRGATDLYAYLKLTDDADLAEVEAALKKRRRWAQGQQSNPKYRSEAVWLIKNLSTLHHVLLEQGADYRSHLDSARSAEALATLEPFILGALADGVLTAKAEAVLLARGMEMGLSEPAMLRRVEVLMCEHGAQRSAVGLASAQTLAISPEDRERLRAGESLSEPPKPPRPLARLRPLEEDPNTSEAPPPPVGLRSLQPGQPAGILSHSPQLAVEAPAEQLVVVGSKPVSVQITVRNVGMGRMSGKVHADRPWLKISPSKLDPKANQQVITLTIEPGEMTRRRGQTRVTVSTRSAGNQSLLLQVQRRRSLLPLAAVGGVIIGVLLFIASQLFSAGTDPADSGSRRLGGGPPPTGDIYIDEELMSTEGVLDIRAGFPTDEPFLLQVMADGFARWTERVTVTGGEMKVLKPELILVDPMVYTPASEAVQGELDEQEVSSAIQSHKTQFDRCFVTHVQANPGQVVILEVRGVVDQMGKVSRLDFQERSYESTTLDACLRRQFRALDLPLLNSRYDYAVFEYIFHYTVPGRSP